MRRPAPAAVVVALCALAATPAAATGAAGPRVETMVVARDGRVTFPARPVLAAATTVAAGRRRCRVAAGTPLAALAAARRAGGPSFGVADLASACSARTARDSAGLFVRRIGNDRNRGQAGWVYKAGTRAGTSGAADPSGPFGAGRLRSGARVLWFWCRAALDCQRSLVVLPAARSLAPGAPLRVTVRAFDDLGRGRAVAGATVTFGRMRAVTGAGGRAVLAGPAPAGAPVAPGRYRLAASARGAIPSFPETVRVG
ncbi:MAG: hypothetical protein U0T02_01555 [Solirubrobacteraceae bacterium]